MADSFEVVTYNIQDNRDTVHLTTSVESKAVNFAAQLGITHLETKNKFERVYIRKNGLTMVQKKVEKKPTPIETKTPLKSLKN